MTGAGLPADPPMNVSAGRNAGSHAPAVKGGK